MPRGCANHFIPFGLKQSNTMSSFPRVGPQTDRAKCHFHKFRVRLAPVVTEETRVICRKRKYLCVWSDDFGEIAFLKRQKMTFQNRTRRQRFPKLSF